MQLCVANGNAQCPEPLVDLTALMQLNLHTAKTTAMRIRLN